jgi:hypothetical protein
VATCETACVGCDHRAELVDSDDLNAFAVKRKILVLSGLMRVLKEDSAIRVRDGTRARASHRVQDDRRRLPAIRASIEQILTLQRETP